MLRSLIDKNRGFLGSATSAFALPAAVRNKAKKPRWTTEFLSVLGYLAVSHHVGDSRQHRSDQITCRSLSKNHATTAANGAERTQAPGAGRGSGPCSVTFQPAPGEQSCLADQQVIDSEAYQPGAKDHPKKQTETGPTPLTAIAIHEAAYDRDTPAHPQPAQHRSPGKDVTHKNHGALEIASCSLR